MCGIAGYAGFEGEPGLIERMARSMRHRGPDDEGFLAGPRSALGMRRLSIIDVLGGHQPIFNEDRSVAVVMNGEIYNYRELLAGLARRGHRLSTRSDTETVVHLFEEEGIGCLDRLRGMFALAIQDLRDGRLFLARDRIGLKPLYYWADAGRLVFASEIKAILACPLVPREPSLPAIDAYLRLRYVPGPGTLFAGIRKLPPGHWLEWREGSLRLERWWSPPAPRPLALSDREHEERFAELFSETVRLHLESDVPVGAFLSGGLDSSLVVAEATRQLGKPLQTFAVGFGWEGDETGAARDVAAALGCDHHEVISPPEALRLLPRIVWHSDEPLGDPITIPSFLLSQAARPHTKVVLTGEGADEVLAGYVFHRVMDLAHAARPLLPAALLNHVAAPLVRRLPLGLLDRFFDYPGELGTRGRKKLAAFLAGMASDDPEEMHALLIRLFDDWDRSALYAPGGGLAAAAGPDPVPGAELAGDRAWPFFERMLVGQFRSWLPDNILARQDKMSMANSVESRIPFLDHVLVEHLATVPRRLKLRALGGANKVLARRLAARLLPPEVAARRKRAFYIPVERMLATPAFRELVGETLDPERVRRRGYFDPAAVAALVAEAERSREFVAIKQVLALAMLELWHRMFIDRLAPPEEV